MYLTSLTFVPRDVRSSTSGPLPTSSRYMYVDKLFGHHHSHTSPEVTPRSPSGFPRIRVDQGKIVCQPGLLELRDIRVNTWRAERNTASLIQVDLIRSGYGE